MKTDPNTIEEEIMINGSRKINIGIRAYPELKQKLAEQAIELGITLSEHAENILLNKDNLQNVVALNLKEIVSLKEHISKLNVLIESISSHRKIEVEKVTHENAKLQKEIIMLNDQLMELKTTHQLLHDQLTLFKDKKLLELFEQLRGTTAIIQTTNGQTISITYDTPADLMRVLIYSFKIKK
jgi:hypothetical protein